MRNFTRGAGLSIRRFSIVEAALLLMVALLASRVLGVVRQIILNYRFGTGLEANAYIAASRLPDTLFNLVAGGALLSAFVPVFLSYEKEQGEQAAWRLASLIFNVLLVALIVLVLVGETLTPRFVNTLLVPGYSATAQALTTTLTRIMLIQPLILGLGSIASAVLNSKRQFLLPALSLAVYNIGVIGGLLCTLLFPHIGIYGPTCGTLVAAVLQVIVLIPGLLKQGARYSFIWDLRHPGLRQILLLLLPNAAIMGLLYITTIIDTRFASYLPDTASLSALNNAEMLQALPAALIGQAIGQSLLPHLTAHATSRRYVRMRQMAIKVMGVSILLTVPAAIVLLLLGKPTIHLLFQHGAFNQHSTNLTTLALLGYAIALPGLAGGNLVVCGFFALKDALTPLCTNTYSVLAHLGLLYLLFHILSPAYTILAIPLALAGAATSEAALLSILLLLRLRKRIKRDRGMLRLQRRRLYLQKLRATMNQPHLQ